MGASRAAPAPACRSSKSTAARVVAERNPSTPLAPASNMKLFTTAAAIDLLHPDFQLTTTVFMRGAVDAAGTLTGDVKVVGHGDPTIGGRFHDGHATAVIDEWATDLKRAGVKTIRGNLIFEYGYMDIEYIHPTWPVDQLVNWYEAPVSAFSMQENCVQVRVTPSRPGKACVVQFEPPTSYLELQSSCITGRGLPFITRYRNTNTIMVRGGTPARTGVTEIFVTIENPVQYFASVTHETFVRNGINVQGQIIVTPRDERPDWKAVSQHTTPLNVVVYVINKKSQNHYAEELVKIIGAEKKTGRHVARGHRRGDGVADRQAGCSVERVSPGRWLGHVAREPRLGERVHPPAALHVEEPVPRGFRQLAAVLRRSRCEVRPSPARARRTRGRCTRRPATSSAWSGCPATCAAAAARSTRFRSSSTATMSASTRSTSSRTRC